MTSTLVSSAPDCSGSKAAESRQGVLVQPFSRPTEPWPRIVETLIDASPWQDRLIPVLRNPAMADPGSQRPPWLNWLILAAFLWSSWQLAELWIQRLHG